MERKSASPPHRYAPPTQSAQSESFWQRRWKPILGAVITLVVIAAVVGGAVGATAGKKKSNQDDASVTVGTGAVSAGDQSGIFGSPSSTSATGGSTLSNSLDTVAVATAESVSAVTQAASSDNFLRQRTARHILTACVQPSLMNSTLCIDLI